MLVLVADGSVVVAHTEHRKFRDHRCVQVSRAL